VGEGEVSHKEEKKGSGWDEKWLKKNKDKG
jgi:hypothetical protein